MTAFFADLHIHIGTAGDGSPVKITASRKLDLAAIARESLIRKGLDIVGVVDCASPPVIRDIESLISKGDITELEKGGFLYQKKLLIIPGVEIESREDNGGYAHYLAYFPYLDNLKEFSAIMTQYITNINLSSQAASLTGSDILRITEATGGTMIPAHVFTPHKSFYGRCFTSCQEVFTAEEWSRIPAIELGLSADTFLAGYLSELNRKTFLSNSDAHSAGKIAREYNLLQLKEKSYEDFILALKRKQGRKVLKNFGLDPRLGKYHRSYCPQCQKSFNEKKPVFICPDCGTSDLITGVKDRILNIADRENSELTAERPSYIYQIPLMDIPGIGRKTLSRLLKNIGTEMEIIHNTDLQELKKYVNDKVAAKIIKARAGQLDIQTGGGGSYGKVLG